MATTFPAALNSTIKKTHAASASVRKGNNPSQGDTAIAGFEMETNPDLTTEIFPEPETHYFDTNQLSLRPQPLSEIEFESLEHTSLLGVGRVKLSLWINEYGDVAFVNIDSSDLPDGISRGLIAIFEAARFQPGEFNGQRVACVMRIEVTYNDSQHSLP